MRYPWYFVLSVTTSYLVVMASSTNFPIDSNSMNLWAEQSLRLPWDTPWQSVCSIEQNQVRWFAGGMLNASNACLDVHIQKGLGEKVAIYWCNERGYQRTITYAQLFSLVNNFAATLKREGLRQGDRVAIYMPMIPEAVVAMLAVARLGGIHVVLFSGFGAQAIKMRIAHTEARFVITASGAWYRGKLLPMKSVIDEATASLPCVEKVFIVDREGRKRVTLRDRECTVDMQLLASAYIKPEPVPSNHPLFILYTSGTTGLPKGMVHSTGGYLTYVYATMDWVFGSRASDVYWCTADIGWITGHSYGVYGPLMHGMTIVMREGAPDYPDPGAWWRVIDEYKVSIFYTAPTALRMFMRVDPEYIRSADLSSLRLLGSVGESIGAATWHWLDEAIGKQRCPIVDTWWQTETGGIMIAPATGRGAVSLKPGSATLPLPGIDAAVVNEQGNQVSTGTRGLLVIRSLWPGLALGMYKDETGFMTHYWSTIPGVFFTGDYAMQDSDGYFWVLGRADDLIKISGHRIGSAEIEGVVAQHEAIAESAAIGVSDDVKGEALVLFVVLKSSVVASANIKEEIVHLIHHAVGAFAKPRAMYVVSRLPKNRSGKIMRRLLKAMLEGKPFGDSSTIEDSNCLAEIAAVIQRESIRWPTIHKCVL